MHTATKPRKAGRLRERRTSQRLGIFVPMCVLIGGASQLADRFQSTDLHTLQDLHEMNSGEHVRVLRFTFTPSLGLTRRTCPKGSTVLLSWPGSAPQAAECRYEGLVSLGFGLCTEASRKAVESWRLRFWSFLESLVPSPLCPSVESWDLGPRWQARLRV